MSDFAKEIQVVPIEEELKKSYLDYAMSVIIGRALPDVRDGFKPVHRRILYAMRELGNDWDKPYKKSARVVGDVIGKYHPHGDAAVYETIVRMAQPFAMRYLLVDGQGNFGSVDGDAPAAMRYTEIRMSRFAQQLLADIECETVDFAPNYDGTEQIPQVLPTRVPHLLVNGSSGIAVGMATNVPPHNLAEVCRACQALLENPGLDLEQLLEYIPGPDFPTAGLINGRAGIVSAYRTGRGRLLLRARARIEDGDKSARQRIIISELPYRVNKARLVERIAELVREKKLQGIAELRDESDKDGIRIVVELRQGEIGEVVLNNLYSRGGLQTSFGINMVTLVEGSPRLLNLKEVLEAFLQHRREVVTRRTLFLLRKARQRAHLLEALLLASAHIDTVVETIRQAASPAAAREQLLARTWTPSSILLGMLAELATGEHRPEDLGAEYGLVEEQGQQLYRFSPEQVQAILELRLQRLTGLEQQKIKDEYENKIKDIKKYIQILSEPDMLREVIRDELRELVDGYGDERRTEIVESQLDLEEEDLVQNERRVFSLTRDGYAIAQSLEEYRSQRRGGQGRSGAAVKEEDLIEQLFVAEALDTLLCFSNLGRVYSLRAFRIPRASLNTRGRPLANLLSLQEGEQICMIRPLRASTDEYLLLCTARGKVKRTPMQAFKNLRRNGLRALRLVEGDTLVSVQVATADADLMLFGSNGRCCRFAVDRVRASGRNAQGVRGMRLRDGAQVVAAIVPGQGEILCISENGYGKRSRLEDFPRKGRGGLGVIALRTNERNSALVAAVQVSAADELIVISDRGTLVRVPIAEISVIGRNTQGVRIARLRRGEKVAAVARVPGNGELQFAQGASRGGAAEGEGASRGSAGPQEPRALPGPACEQGQGRGGGERGHFRDRRRDPGRGGGDRLRESVCGGCGGS